MGLREKYYKSCIFKLMCNRNKTGQKSNLFLNKFEKCMNLKKFVVFILVSSSWNKMPCRFVKEIGEFMNLSSNNPRQ
jgi:hypothetical protein